MESAKSALRAVYPRLEKSARNLLLLENAEQTVKKLSGEQQAAVRRCYEAGARRAQVARELSDDRSAVAAIVLHREAAAMFIAAIAISHDAGIVPEDFIVGAPWEALEKLSSSGALAALPENVRETGRILTRPGPLVLDDTASDEILRMGTVVESGVRWLEALVEPRSLAEIRFSRGIRVTFSALAAAALAVWLVWSAVRPTNVALHKPVTASSHHPQSVAPADNSGFTNGEIEASYGVQTLDGGAWVMVDLLKPFKLSKIKIYNRGDGYQETGLPFTLELSNDAEHFVEGEVRRETFGNTTPWVFDARGQTARYIRVRSGNYVSLAELEAFGK